MCLSYDFLLIRDITRIPRRLKRINFVTVIISLIDIKISFYIFLNGKRNEIDTISLRKVHFSLVQTCYNKLVSAESELMTLLKRGGKSETSRWSDKQRWKLPMTIVNLMVMADRMEWNFIKS